MNTTARTYEISMNTEERARLMLYIEHWFTNAINGYKHLFQDMNATVALMTVAQQIKEGEISLTVNKYQAKLITDAIYDTEKRWNIKTNEIYLPKDFCSREMYDCFEKISK